MCDISRFQLLLDDILASTEKMARQPTGSFRVLKGLKGLKRLNRDESELRQFHRCLDEAGQAFVVATTARVKVSVTRIEGLTTRIKSSTTRTELSTTQIQLSTSKLELSNSHIKSNIQAMQTTQASSAADNPNNVSGHSQTIPASSSFPGAGNVTGSSSVLTGSSDSLAANAGSPDPPTIPSGLTIRIPRPTMTIPTPLPPIIEDSVPHVDAAEPRHPTGEIVIQEG
ncbi:hypothetical protein C8J56DRAFT_1062795 [Mycena floridula]|nr:hypothetical protein C8J56DRAFT_1062795 [Mycena floridula]